MTPTSQADKPAEQTKHIFTESVDRPAILIIDDDAQILRLLQEILAPEYDCTTATSAEEALTILGTMKFDVVMSDINMGTMSGLEVVPVILQQSSDTVVVMISGQQSIDSAIEAMRAGAFDYITKPLNILHVETAVRRALSQHQLLRKKRWYENHLEQLLEQRTREVAKLAYYDRLTELPNRSLFTDRCKQALAFAGRQNQTVGVMLVSLDRFKAVSGTLGYAAAEVLLLEAATRLRACLGEGDTAARLEADEFAVLLTNVTHSGSLVDTGSAIVQAFRRPFDVGDGKVYLTASVGISEFPTNGDDNSTIIANAGAALDRARNQGGNNYQFYAVDMNERAEKRLALETSLRGAVSNNQIVVHYQPIVSLATNHMLGVEALARWRHPELGLLAPAAFLPVAEELDLIVEIDEAVLTTACLQLREWAAAGLDQLRLAINISARHFRHEGFMERIIATMKESRVDLCRLELELTETAIVENPDTTADTLRRLRQAGVRVSIDDFGTGYSSLSYLKRLPIDTVKLDRFFVNEATNDPNDAALVMSIITLAHNLNLKVVAEGIETDEQRRFLRLLRCDEGQGYLFGRPAPADSIRGCEKLRTLPRNTH